MRSASRGDPLIDHAVVWSHHESGRYALLVTSDHRHLVWDRRARGTTVDAAVFVSGSVPRQL